VAGESETRHSELRCEEAQPLPQPLFLAPHDNLELGRWLLVLLGWTPAAIWNNTTETSAPLERRSACRHRSTLLLRTKRRFASDRYQRRESTSYFGNTALARGCAPGHTCFGRRCQIHSSRWRHRDLPSARRRREPAVRSGRADDDQLRRVPPATRPTRNWQASSSSSA